MAGKTIYADDLLHVLRDNININGSNLARVRRHIEAAPAVDAVEVPCRCKECKHWKHFDHLGCTEFVKVCTLAYYMIGENGYCLYGERGAEDGNT